MVNKTPQFIRHKKQPFDMMHKVYAAAYAQAHM
jgi:hypothetical protein